MNNNFDLEYSTKQGLFHWADKDDCKKPGWFKVAKSVPLDVLIEFNEEMHIKFNMQIKKTGKFPLGLIDAVNEFSAYKQINCPKERAPLIELIGYNSFTDNISLMR